MSRKPTIDVDSLTREEEDAILAQANRELGSEFFFDSLEELLCHPEGFDLDARGTVTNLQRAICRIVEGRLLGELAKDPIVLEALGSVDSFDIDGHKPSEVVILAAVRTAKSMLAAANAIWAARTCDLSGLTAGEIPRYSILSLELDNARVVLGHLIGALTKPRLQSLRVPSKSVAIIDDVGADVIGSEFLYHPSGRVVEIRVVAGKRAGGSLVSRWSAGLTLDEAPRMIGASEGVINYEDAYRAVRSRLLPGAQILSIGSPWQPFGPVYDMVQNNWGRPTRDRVVIKARGPDMNPEWWNEERCAEIKRVDPITYQTDVLAEFADAEEALFPQALLAKSTRKEPLSIGWAPRHDYVAAMDPATRGNAWTLVIASRRGRTKRIVYAAEWKGSPVDPLSPRVVLGGVARILKEYKLDWCYTDQWAADANRDIAREEGFNLLIEEWTSYEKTEAYLSLAASMGDGTIELPDYPTLQKDLKLVKKKPNQKGVAIHLPSTPDGRHCDFAPSIVRALKKWIDDEQPELPKYGSSEWTKHIENKMIEQEEAAIEMADHDSIFDEIEDDDPYEEYAEAQSLLSYAKDNWG